jgi:hypothetical protein
MSDKAYDTIIVGAGISGLACARQLSKYDQDFFVISKDIGGRILNSEDGSANYGAFFVCLDYDNFLKYSTIKSRIRLRDFCFHEKDKTYVLFEPKVVRYLPQFLKVEKLLYKFRKKLRLLRKKSVGISQKRAIENDPFLYKLYMQNAVDFVKENKLERGTDVYLSKALYSTTFSSISEMNAFSFLQFLLPLITPIYTFKFEKEKMIKPFKENIKIGTVTDIKYTNNLYRIKSGDSSYYSKNIVLATDILWSKNYAGVKKVNKPVNTNMLHIKGKLKDNYKQRKYHLFSPPGNVQAIADLEDGTYLFYFKNNPNLVKDYFYDSQIIGRKDWKPAGTINGHNLIEFNRGKNMYLIGDCNIAGLEESYITGLFCAKQILRSI